MSKVYRTHTNLSLRILEIIKHASTITVNWKHDLLWSWESKIYVSQFGLIEGELDSTYWAPDLCYKADITW